MTVEFVAFCTGLALMIVAIFGGGLEIREVKIANLGPLPRALSALMGGVLLYVYFFEPEKFVVAKPEQTKTDVSQPAEHAPPPPQPANPQPGPGAEQAGATKPANPQSGTGEQAESAQPGPGSGASSGAKPVEDPAYTAKLEQELTEATKALRESQAAWKRAVEDLQRTREQAKERPSGPVGTEGASKGAQDRVAAAQKKVETESVALKQAAKTVISKKMEVDEAIEKAAPSKDEGSTSKAPVIGYVIYAVINKDNSIRKAFFSLEGDGRFPGPNDVITSKSAKIALRGAPYHWDGARKKTVQEGDALTYIGLGQKLRVARDVFISTDPQNGNQYAIAPIAEAVNFRVDSGKKEVLQLDNNDPGVAGYVHLGLIDENTGDFVEKHFENQTRPNTTIPAPNDRLLAKRDTNIRKGPRYWDAAKGEYVTPSTVGVIKAGQIVVVGGDTYLARQGQSIWTPIAR